MFWVFTDTGHILVLVQVRQKADALHEHLLCVHLCDWSLYWRQTVFFCKGRAEAE